MEEALLKAFPVVHQPGLHVLAQGLQDSGKRGFSQFITVAFVLQENLLLDQVEGDALFVALVQDAEGPSQTIVKVGVKEVLDPIERLREGHAGGMLVVLRGWQLVAAPAEKPFGFQHVQMLFQALSDQIEWKCGLLHFVCNQQRLNLELFRKIIDSVHLGFVDGDLSMQDLVHHVRELQLAASFKPLWLVHLLLHAVLGAPSAHLAHGLQQRQVHQLVHIEALIDVDLEAVLDELADLLVLVIPLRLAEVKIGHVCRGHLGSHATDHQHVEYDASAPYVCLVRHCAPQALVPDLRRQVHPIRAASFISESQMAGHVNELHDCDVNNSQVNRRFVNVQA